MPGYTTSPLDSSPWDRNARDWAELQEAKLIPAYSIVLKALGYMPGQCLLDLGCASGVLCDCAASRGLISVGLDSSAALLAFARRRTPAARFIRGDMEELPFKAGTFNIVTMMNSLPYAASPLHALREAHRVLAPRGRIAIATWGVAGDCNSAAIAQALGPYLRPGGRLESLAEACRVDIASEWVARAGFMKLLGSSALTIWDYSDEESVLRGFLSHGLAQEAVLHSGFDAVHDAIKSAVAPYRMATGRYRLQNRLDYIIAQRL